MTQTQDISAQLAAGRWLFAQKTLFRREVVHADDLPPADRIEIAFAGRSNVGKSSLLNALTGTKNLAHTSSTPGRTQGLNFFALAAEHSTDGNGLLWLVDMPGYGYARQSKAKIRNWQNLLIGYLRGRANLRRVFLLIDARHGLKKNDREMMAILDEMAVSWQMVLTKIDQIKEAEQADMRYALAAELAKCPAAHPDILLTSGRNNAGIAALRAEIAALVDLSAIGYKTED